MHWCSRGVRFNEVPEKVPKVPEKVPGNLGAKRSQVKQSSGEGSGGGSGVGSREGRGGFGVEPGQVQQGSGEGSGEAPLEINIFWMLLVSTRYGYFNLFHTFFLHVYTVFIRRIIVYLWI